MRDKPKTNSKQNQPTAPQKTEDVAVVWGRRDDGSMNILRKREDRVEAGTVQPLKEGAPIHGEVIQLKPRENSPLCDVETVLQGPTAKAVTDVTAPRPAQVATDSYRKNWDSIWKRRKPTAEKVLN